MRSGEYVNNLNGELLFKTFKAKDLPVELFLTDEINEKLNTANKKIAYLNGYVSNIPNINLYSYMYIKKEALHSSEIEGTQCTLIDVFDIENAKNDNRDLKDVISYINALEFGINRLNELPISKRFIKEVHKCLIANSRGNEKDPGEFRNSQNWIGGVNSSLKNARFIPPNIQDMEASLDNLEKFINYDNSYDPIINASLIHYQFETIHPFLDGNGRIGRMLILFYLVSKDIIKFPLVSLSYYLKLNQLEYYDRMMLVRNKGEYEQWINFFLECLIDSINDSIETIDKLKKLHEENAHAISKYHKKEKKLKLLFSYIEAHPILNIGSTAKELNMSYNTVDSLIKTLMELNILENITDKKRNRRYGYMKYIKILNGEIW